MITPFDRSPTWAWLRCAVAEVLAVAFFVMLASVGVSQAKKAPTKNGARPNIVLIQADDAIRGDIRFMPNVSRLMDRGGTQFSNYVVPYPLCGPARASLLTGQLSHNNQVLSNFRSNDGGHLRFKDLPGRLNQKNSLGPWLQRAGYRTALVGKYLNEYGSLDRTEIPPGWDRWATLLDNSTYDYFNYAMNVDGKVQFHGDRKYAEAQLDFATLGTNDPPESFGELIAQAHEAFQPYDYFGTQDESQYSMDVNGRFAANFVKNAAPKRKPFFLYYAPPGPHAEDTNHLQGLRQGAPTPDPRPPIRYADTYDKTPLPRPASFNEADVSDKASNLKNLPLLTDAQISDITDNYRGRLGALRSVDDQVGKITKQLKKAGEFRNTYFIFTSDNGYMQGEHRLRSSKFLPYENSINVPALMSGPGIKAGKTRTGSALDVDITATVLDMAGARSGRTADGISLLPAAKGRKGLPKRDQPIEAMRPLFRFYTPVTAFDLPYYGVRTDRYKYIHWSFNDESGKPETELYDLKKDPDELNNIAADPARAGLVAQLEAKASRLRECRGSNCR
ncbi:MAG TPA: sulfatase [Solirubrobacterales bacterium]|nr:sulfatase [Solirubrobacterales bacterium]